MENDVANAHKKVFTRQVDIFYQTSLGNIAIPSSKLRTYSLVKNHLGTEEYLTCVKNTKHRVELSKFRLSNHELMIEVGRHKKNPSNERFCPLCPNPVVEDEIHFLVNCQSFSGLRKDILSNKIMTTTPHYINIEKFIAIMSEPDLILAKFIFKAMELRKTLIIQKDSRQEEENLNQTTHLSVSSA